MGINRTAGSVLTIEKKVLTSWRGICYVIVVMQNNIQGRINLIEDGIMDKKAKIMPKKRNKPGRGCFASKEIMPGE